MRGSRAGQRGNHQFQRPIRATTAGTISSRITVASSRIPAARPVAMIFTSVSGRETIKTNREEQDQRAAGHRSPSLASNARIHDGV